MECDQERVSTICAPGSNLIDARVRLARSHGLQAMGLQAMGLQAMGLRVTILAAERPVVAADDVTSVAFTR